jgi:hypothetical protein
MVAKGSWGSHSPTSCTVVYLAYRCGIVRTLYPHNHLSATRMGEGSRAWRRNVHTRERDAFHACHATRPQGGSEGLGVPAAGRLQTECHRARDVGRHVLGTLVPCPSERFQLSLVVFGP